MALDIGAKRIGVAISDPSGRVATPLAVIGARETEGDAAALRKLLIDYQDVATLVIGLPLSLDGAEGPQARHTRVVGTKIAEKVGLPVVFVDERLSSSEAKRRMLEAGADSRAQRGSLDKVAAAVVLQAYLDSLADGATS